MAFGWQGNRHDSWLRFCDRHRECLVGAGLPDWLARSEERFRDLLRDGSASDRHSTVSLAELTADCWPSFAGFVSVFFRECESFAPLDLFPAYRREAERRSVISDAEPGDAAVSGA